MHQSRCIKKNSSPTGVVSVGENKGSSISPVAVSTLVRAGFLDRKKFTLDAKTRARRTLLAFGEASRVVRNAH